MIVSVTCNKCVCFYNALHTGTYLRKQIVYTFEKCYIKAYRKIKSETSACEFKGDFFPHVIVCVLAILSGFILPFRAQLEMKEFIVMTY